MTDEVITNEEAKKIFETEKFSKSYLGRSGCGCGCKGTYFDYPRGFKRRKDIALDMVNRPYDFHGLQIKLSASGLFFESAEKYVWFYFAD